MSSILRQFRGLGIALAVLAISAGAVFAAAPSLQLSSSHRTTSPSVDASGSIDPSASASAEPTESAEPSDSAEPSESVEPSESPNPSGSPAASQSADNHGALVSTAAQMPTPSGFPNHGAFVSCVAHMDVSAVGFDWTTVTPQSCGIAPAGSAQPSSGAPTNGHGHGHGNGKGHGSNGHGQGPSGS